VTRKETPIPCVYSNEDLNLNTGKMRILLIGGLDGSEASVSAVINAVNWFYGAEAAKPLREKFSLSAVPIANPDGWVFAAGAEERVTRKSDPRLSTTGLRLSQPHQTRDGIFVALDWHARP